MLPSFFRPSILNIVRFPNEECFDASNQSGTCYTAFECKKLGGVPSSPCARGLGACCIGESFKFFILSDHIINLFDLFIGECEQCLVLVITRPQTKSYISKIRVILNQTLNKTFVI